MKACWIVAVFALLAHPAQAQDVPGIEICTVDKTMERRTSCLQSNVDFLVKTINRLRTDTDQKLDALNRQNAALRAGIAELQKSLAEMKPAKLGTPTPVAKEPATKDAPVATKDAPAAPNAPARSNTDAK